MSRRLVVSIALLGWVHGSWAAPAGGGPTGTPDPGAPVVSDPDPGVPRATGDPGTTGDTGDTGRAPPLRVAPADAPPPAAPVRSEAAGPTSPGAAPRFQWQPFGYLRVQGAVVQNDPNVAFVGRADGFELQNARLGVRGALGARAGFEISFDGAVDEREQVNVPNGRLRVGLRDARVDLHLAAALTLRVGRFEIWFDPDGHDGDTERGFVDRALESRGVRATEGWQTDGLPPGRSLGLALRWRLIAASADADSDDAAPARASAGPDARPAAHRPAEGVELELAAQNGADEFASNNDNDSPALSLAVRAAAPALGWAQLAGRWNQRTEGELPFRQDETDLEASLALGATVGPVGLAAGGVLVRTSFATTGGSAQRAWGAHGQALVRLPLPGRPLDAGYRFAILDPSSLVLTDRLMEHTAGLVLALPELRARLQLNLTHAVEQAARQLSNDRLEAVLEVAL